MARRPARPAEPAVVEQHHVESGPGEAARIVDQGAGVPSARESRCHHHARDSALTGERIAIRAEMPSGATVAATGKADLVHTVLVRRCFFRGRTYGAGAPDGIASRTLLAGNGVPWHTKLMTAVAPTARTYELIAAIADRVALEADETIAAMDAAVIEVVPEFGADAAIAAELTATNRGNWLRFLAVARQAQSPLSDAVPPEALDAARTVVRRGIDLDRIYEGYRRGQQVGVERWLACAYEIVEPGPELIGVTELSLSLAFRYIDQTLGRVLAEAQREREEVIGGALARRTETIRLILDGAPIDPTAASRRLGYELDRRHTAVVVWAESAVAPHGALESTAVLLAQAAGSQRPLTLPAGTTTLWAWIGTPGEPAIEDLRSAMGRSPDDVRVAVGPTRRGIEGFRDSHEAALTVHRVLLGNPASGRFGSYRELEVTALAAHDPRAASRVHRRDSRPACRGQPRRGPTARNAACLPRGGRQRTARSSPAVHPPQHDPQADRTRDRAARLPAWRATARHRAGPRTTAPPTATGYLSAPSRSA